MLFEKMSAAMELFSQIKAQDTTEVLGDGNLFLSYIFT